MSAEAPKTPAAATAPAAAAPDASAVPFTVRRAAAKVGRNDPCPCGSGRKYKKCCWDKDRARLADNSPYAGLTMEEAKRDPARHGDPAIFLDMTPEELGVVELSPLPLALVVGYMDAALERRRFDDARRAFAEVARRPDVTPEQLAGERDQLVFQLLAFGDRPGAEALLATRPAEGERSFRHLLNLLVLDGQRRTSAARGKDAASQQEKIALQQEDVALQQEDAALQQEDAALQQEDAAPQQEIVAPQHSNAAPQQDDLGATDAAPSVPALLVEDGLGQADALAEAALDAQGPLTSLSDALGLAGVPALAVLVARAAATLPNREPADLETLEGVLLEEREKLGRDPEDPAFWLWERRGKNRRSTRPASADSEEAAGVRARLKERDAELLKLRAELDRASAELKRAALLPAPAAPASIDEEELRRLRRKNEEQAGELRQQKLDAAALRAELRAANEARAALESDDGGDGERPGELDEPDAGDAAALPSEAALRPVRFEPEFWDSLRGIDDPRVALRAQEAALRFAAFDPAVWKQAKKMQDLDDVYTLRVGIHHRLFLLRDAGGVRAREVVTREAFDRALKRYRR